MTRGEPLLLLHGVTMSGAAWANVVPLLTSNHQVIAPTAMGHRGGAPLTGKASIQSLTDEVERLLDTRGFDRVHVAGNSLGGWMAIELARRGRALSVCALSPAGFWPFDRAGKDEGPEKVRRTKRVMHAVSPLAPALLRSGYIRRRAMSMIAEHGDRLTPTQARDAVLDVVYCAAAEDLLSSTETVAPLDPTPCPITLAWGVCDKVLPPDIYGVIARERIPGANYLPLSGVGHVPMIDDPALCAETILNTTGARRTAK